MKGAENIDPELMKKIERSIELLSVKHKPRMKQHKLSEVEKNLPRAELLSYLRSLWMSLPKAPSFKYFPNHYSLPDEKGFSYNDLLLKIADCVVKYLFCNKASVEISEKKNVELPTQQGK